MDGCCSRAGQGGRPSPVHDMIQPAISPTTPNADMLFPLNSPHRAFRAPQATRAARRARPNLPSAPAANGEPDPTWPLRSHAARGWLPGLASPAARGAAGIFHSPLPPATPGGRGGARNGKRLPNRSRGGHGQLPACLPSRSAPAREGRIISKASEKLSFACSLARALAG